MGYGDLEIKSGKFIKIEAGQPQDIRILNENPYQFTNHPSKVGKPIRCTGRDTCAICKDGHEPQDRFSTNVFNHTQSRVMIWEFGNGVAKQLKSVALSLKEEGQDLMNVDLRVSVTGSGQEKRYTVTPRMTSKAVPEGLSLYGLEDWLPF